MFKMIRLQTYNLYIVLFLFSAAVSAKNLCLQTYSKVMDVDSFLLQSAAADAALIYQRTFPQLKNQNSSLYTLSEYVLSDSKELLTLHSAVLEESNQFAFSKEFKSSVDRIAELINSLYKSSSINESGLLSRFGLKKNKEADIKSTISEIANTLEVLESKKTDTVSLILNVEKTILELNLLYQKLDYEMNKLQIYYDKVLNLLDEAVVANRTEEISRMVLSPIMDSITQIKTSKSLLLLAKNNLIKSNSLWAKQLHEVDLLRSTTLPALILERPELGEFFNSKNSHSETISANHPLSIETDIPNGTKVYFFGEFGSIKETVVNGKYLQNQYDLKSYLGGFKAHRSKIAITQTRSGPAGNGQVKVGDKVRVESNFFGSFAAEVVAVFPNQDLVVKKIGTKNKYIFASKHLVAK